MEHGKLIIRHMLGAAVYGILLADALQKKNEKLLYTFLAGGAAYNILLAAYDAHIIKQELDEDREAKKKEEDEDGDGNITYTRGYSSYEVPL